MPRGRPRKYTPPKDDIWAHCTNCGAVLNTETGVLATPDWYKETRFVHYCKDCQSGQFEDFVDYVGVDMAFYLCCAAYNLPFIPEAVPSRRNVDGESWKMYLENTKMLDQDVTDNGEPAAFSDGMTDLSVIFDGKVPHFPTFAGGLTAGGVAEKLEGTRAQRKKWGLSYKTPEYKELDRYYSIHSQSYGKIDEELEFELREICKLQLLYSQQLAKPDIKGAKETHAIIRAKKDEIRKREKDTNKGTLESVDTIRTVIERAGIAKNAKQLTLKEVTDYIAQDHPHYPMGLDVVDQILGCIYNTIRVNEGAGETLEMPISLQVTPMFGEFEPGSSEQEKKLIADTELTPVRRQKE